MSQAETPTPARRRRWPWIVLTVSLALNALLIGVMLRAAWQFRAGAFVAGNRIETALPAFISSLPADRREVLRKDVVTDRPTEIRQKRRQLRQARDDAVKAFLAEPFDKAAFIAAQDRLIEAELAVRRTVRGMLPEIAGHMTLEERRSYLRWRSHGRRWRGARWRDNDDDGGRHGGRWHNRPAEQRSGEPSQR